MERDLDFEKRYDYDPSINYEDVLKKIFELLPTNKEAAVEVMRKHGGMISIYGKRDYQKRLKGLINSPKVVKADCRKNIIVD